MNSNMKLANLLADNIDEFIQFVYNNQHEKSVFLLNKDKSYQLRLFIEEYKCQITADELHRINRFCWNDTYTHLLVADLQKGLYVMDEYVERNDRDLFIYSARLHTLKNLSELVERVSRPVVSQTM